MATRVSLTILFARTPEFLVTGWRKIELLVFAHQNALLVHNYINP